MKTIIIYTSQTGFTKRYAEWISEASGAECVEFVNSIHSEPLARYFKAIVTEK